MQTSPDKIRWDLSPLFDGTDDQNLSDDLTDALYLAKQFREAFHGRIKAAENFPESFVKAVQDYEKLQLKILISHKH